MNLAAIRTAMISAVREAAQDAALDVTWGDRETGWRQPVHVKITQVSSRRLGSGERRYSTASEAALEATERIYIPRVLTLQIATETEDQDLESSALEVAERVAAGLELTAVQEILDGADLGISSIGELRSMAYYDGHGDWRSHYSFEVRLNTHTSHTGGTVDRILGVSASGTIDGDAVQTYIVHGDGILAFPTQHFNIGKIGVPDVADTPGTPDPSALAAFSQLNVSYAHDISVIHLHGIEDLGSGSVSVELFRRRGGVMTWLGEATLTGGGGDFATASVVPAAATLEPDDYLFCQVSAYSGLGGYDGLTVDVHFV